MEFAAGALPYQPDLSELKGQPALRRAIDVDVAGNHNLLILIPRTSIPFAFQTVTRGRRSARSGSLPVAQGYGAPTDRAAQTKRIHRRRGHLTPRRTQDKMGWRR
jgi:hypothetical protein